MAASESKYRKLGEDYDLDLFLKEAIGIAKIAGKLVREAFKSDKKVSTKEYNTDLVTETDQECERIIIEHFKKTFPTHSFIGEESVAAGEQCNLTDNPTWIVDPIDGTTNFVHRFPYVSVSIALAIKKELVIGVIYNPILDQMYSAIAGQGATCNGKPIKVTGQTEINKALLLSEMGAERNKERMDGIMKNLTKILTEPHMAHSVRSLGSACCNMCCVATGECDGYFEFGIHCWDIAAGIVIVQEAGGVCCGATAGPLDIMARQIICGSSEALTKSICDVITPIPHKRD